MSLVSPLFQLMLQYLTQLLIFIIIHGWLGSEPNWELCLVRFENVLFSDFNWGEATYPILPILICLLMRFYDMLCYFLTQKIKNL